MSGGPGYDTYRANFGDRITDSDHSGRILIGNVPLEGNANPNKDTAGNIIDGQWILNGYRFNWGRTQEEMQAIKNYTIISFK